MRHNLYFQIKIASNMSTIIYRCSWKNQRCNRHLVHLLGRQPFKLTLTAVAKSQNIAVMPQISVNYILLCGQFVLLLAVLLLQCLDGIHSQNSTEQPGNTVTTTSKPVVFNEQPEENVTESVIPTETSNHTEQYEYNPPSPVILCRYL